MARELRRYSKNEREETCSLCEGCGLHRGKLCGNCNGHGLVLVVEQLSFNEGEVKRYMHDYEPTIEVQRMMRRGVLV